MKRLQPYRECGCRGPEIGRRAAPKRIGLQNGGFRRLLATTTTDTAEMNVYRERPGRGACSLNRAAAPSSLVSPTLGETALVRSEPPIWRPGWMICLSPLRSLRSYTAGTVPQHP